MRIFAATITLAALSLAACGGSVITADATTSGAAATSGAGTGGSAGEGGGISGTGGGGSCTPQPFDPDAGAMKPTCADLGAMTVGNPALHPEGGDDVLSAGGSAVFTVDLEETAGEDFFWYPEVKFSSDTPGVSVDTESPLYGIAACQSVPMSTHITVAPGVPKGTVVHIGAQVAMLGADCPGAPAISVPVVVH